MTIIISDQTDSANGSARVSPHPIITIFPVAPYSLSAMIGEFKNNVHEILAHEYTHILNMEPVHGWMSPVYWIFGSIAHPNMILPRWYTEGLAVYTESAFSDRGGRLNSQYVEGIARSLTLEKSGMSTPFHKSMIITTTGLALQGPMFLVACFGTVLFAMVDKRPFMN